MVLLLYLKVVKIVMSARTLRCLIYLWAIVGFVKKQLMAAVRSCFLVSVSNLMPYVCRRSFPRYLCVYFSGI